MSAADMKMKYCQVVLWIVRNLDGGCQGRGKSADIARCKQCRSPPRGVESSLIQWSAGARNESMTSFA